MSTTSEKPVGTLKGSVVRNKNGTVRNYRFGQTKPYELWSNEEGTSWSIREPETVELGGSGFGLDGGITKSEGTVIVRNGVKTEGYENFLSDELYNKGTNTIKTKIKKDRLNGVVEYDDFFFDAGDPKKLNPNIIYDENGNPTGVSKEIVDDEEEKADVFNPENFKGIQRSDRVLQKLNLRNLKYPIDADYGNTQDYIQINQFTYKAVNPEVLFAPQLSNAQDTSGRGRGGTVLDAFGRDDDDPNYGLARRGDLTDNLNSLQLSGRQAKNTLLNGLSMQSPKEEHIGLVKLPMPNQLSDSNNVAWGEDQLNAITAAAATIAAGGLDTGINFLQDIASGNKGFGEAVSNILTGTGDSFQGIIQFLKDAQKSPNANLLARSTVGSSLLNLVGFGVSPEAILARGAGIVPNSNLQLLFNAPTLRAFRFDWKMSPRSREEAIRINNIIRFFKQGMAAKKMQANSGGGAYFLGTPNVFDVTFRTSKLKRELGNENISVMRMKTCACVGAAVNYTPEGMWNAYEKGQPTSCILSLQFKELEPLFNTDYEEDPFVYSNMGDFVPTDSVGY